MKKKKSTPTSRNLKISTRITLTSVLGIVIPLVIVIVFSSVFLSTMATYFNFSTVTTDSYSMLNQIQWSQTMSSISNELISTDDNDEKLKRLEEFLSPIENLGSNIYIECNGNNFYSTSNKDDIIDLANEITPIDTNINTNYFSENGIVIVNHAQSKNEEYLVIITNNDYIVNDVSERYNAQNFSSLMFGKTGIILLLIALVFTLSIIILSLITSRTISKPIKELSEGANEIANGNLDYVIDYDSTNEIGTTVKSFNHMTKRLKQSIEEQHRIEDTRKEMIAGVAHDLRTPLTSVRGYVEGLIDGIANTPEKRDEYLKIIYSSTNHMEKLLDELLTVSRLELGTIELNAKPTNLIDYLNECAETMRIELNENNFDFEYINNCQEELIVNLDTDRFTRVIKNIMSNSIKYARKDVKGKITLEVQNYQKSVIISLADNGIGLDKESLPRIFDTFYRADKARSNVSEGSGIGLAVCKQIVELHGGHIWATSEENEGLTIFISIDRKQD
jgi:signal transduction histidine kinase